MTKKILTKILPFILLAAAIVIVAVYGVYAYNVHKNGYDAEWDKTAGHSNVNVMLTRPDNWHKIQTGKINIPKSYFRYIDGSTATIPITAELARQFCDAKDEEINDYVDHNTTHNAYINLIGNAADDSYYEKELIFVTEPSDEEKELAESKGVGMDVTPVAMDGFVFITHKDNPVESLTVEQIQKIYSGEITNWKEVGGNDAEIIPYQREKNSGSQTAMENMVMKGKELMEPKEAYFEVTGMGDLVEHIAEYHNSQNSLGYTYYYYINNLYKNDNIKVLKIDGVSPDNENLISRKYPFTTAYYAVIDKKDEGMAREIRDYILTDEGQEIVSLAGYCPVRQVNGDE